MSKPNEFEGYCVKCKAKREFVGVVRLTKNKRSLAQGPCPVCGTTVNRILGKKDVLNLAT
jgi:Domain of unknown function (DUF5679)